MAETQLNPGEGDIVVGVALDDCTFLGRVKTAQLRRLAKEPRLTEDDRQLRANPELADLRRVRQEVQRLFEGEKKRNVEPYSDYIVEVVKGGVGMMPPIVLWTSSKLPYNE